MIDARAAIPLVASLLHVAWWTVTPALIILALSLWLERIGYDFNSAWRAFRSSIAGKYRPPVTGAKLHRTIDYGRRDNS